MSYRLYNNDTVAHTVANTSVSFSQSVAAKSYVLVTDTVAFALTPQVANTNYLELERVVQPSFQVVSSTATVTQVASSATSVALLAANSARNKGMLTNASTAILYVLLGSGTASTTNYSFTVAASGVANLPDGFTGPVTGIWASANGYAYLTEMTP
jgi:hypothetical protein